MVQEEQTTAGPPEADDSLGPWVMFLLAVIAGLFGGLGSIAFRVTIGAIHNLFFYGELSAHFDPNADIAATHWAPWVIFVPVLGAPIVTWITNTFAPEARGHGVPEVMNAIHYQRGIIRPMVVIAKAAASAVSIGTGGSVGREGPIIQIGSAFGSLLGQIVKMPARQRIVLVGAGAAAGIAATFNAPIGGLAFAFELMLVSISARTVSLVAVATVTATYISRWYWGLAPSFNIPSLASLATHHVGIVALLLSAVLGLLTGLASALFIASIYWFEDRFQGLFPNLYVRHSAGMLALGLLLYVFMQASGQYYVGGVGYGTIIDILTNTLTNPYLLLALFFGKLLATGLTLGSGASGGVFSPALFLGASLGALFGHAAGLLFPDAGLDPVMFAVAGMAAMFSGATGAVITAITMLFEQTRDYAAILPVIIAVALAYALRVYLVPESIYTLKLVRRGLGVPQGLEAAISTSRYAHTIMTRDIEVVDFEDLKRWQAEHKPGDGPRYTVVTRDGGIYGIAREDLGYLLPDAKPEFIVDTAVFFVASNTPWAVLLRGMKAKGTQRAVVLWRRRSRDPKDVAGVITSREILEASTARAELMS